MKANLTTVFLETPGATTPVSLNNGVPDFSVFTGATLAVVLQAWEEFVNSGQELEMILVDDSVEDLPQPNWDGLYLQLMASPAYADLVGVGQEIPGVDGALDKTIDAIQYGIFKSDSLASLPAFQSAINLLMYALAENQVALSTEQLQQVRNALDANGFNSIQLE